ncbi:pyridoxal-dependent decarboxylase, exosortase A system-associated [Pseudoalteromonas sp. S16_S37]|uniref:pyridoxal-dependent decarboxylase, exosortase A system-associated n=1 Tax=Pseudoalteromonas sp. S16_S37 TaxID=2720228 RepID=UPI0016808E59|nr:pyridoxal-dependent decarboxylase, exosortase A system-associated [Pseudoalteromonas sp. S16_S37]MBD1584449.1 pyridoxal-dependent decarboxylase, exosortase A system-associated [Pseudoalteromonas sp. S16_S37]
MLDNRIKFKANEQGLLINGLGLDRVQAIAGSLPCYVYDKSLIKARIQALKAAMPEKLNIHYAMKANPSPSVVHFISQMLDGLDVASHQELKLALETNTPAFDISMAGPGKSEEDIASAVAAGITLNVESVGELKRIYEAKDRLGVEHVNLALRINPDFKVKGTGMAMGGNALQFGTDREMLTELMQEVRDKQEIVGLHLFSGSQNLNAEALCVIYQKTFETAASIVEEFGLSLKKLNIGGGLGIPYFDKEQDLDLSNISQVLGHQIDQWHANIGECEVEMELGRYLVAEAGVYLCKVTDIKDSRGKRFIVTNGGLHHHLSATGNFGQVFRQNYPIAIANKMLSEDEQEYHIVGPLCTPIDTLASDLPLPKAEIGDIIAIFQSGAYGFTASPHLFLSQPKPIEILL